MGGSSKNEGLNNLNWLFLQTILFIGLSYWSSIILEVDDAIYISLSESFTQKQVNSFIEVQKKWEWLGVIMFPLLLLIKTSIIAVLLNIGCFFFDKKISYKRLFNIVIKSEFIFLSVIVFKTVWFYFFKTDYTFEDLQYFYPFSVLSIIGYEGIRPWYVYPLQVLNLFELVYWVILAYLIDKEINDFSFKGVSIVASSYGVSLLIWVVGVMFFTLNIS